MITHTVRTVPKSDTYDWLLHKHYAKRLPMAVEFAYGLYDESVTLVGVCTFGPCAPPVPVTIFGEIGKHKVRELTRLVVNDGLPPNTLSYFVASCLKMLPGPMCVVSFADSGAGHHGYIYQATNWLYTGEGGNAAVIEDKDGVPVHSLTVNEAYVRENITRTEYLTKHGLTESPALPKHRYLQFVGDKRQRRTMRGDVILRERPYPKGDNERYDASYEPQVQMVLF